jgi:hypothetical protein
MNVLERASFGRLICQPDIDLDFNTEAYLSRPLWAGQRIEITVLQEVAPDNVFNLTPQTSRFTG